MALAAESTPDLPHLKRSMDDLLTRPSLTKKVRIWWVFVIFLQRAESANGSIGAGAAWGVGFGTAVST